MKKLIYLASLLLLLLSSCEEHEFKILEGTSWQITDYTIDGTDSMATITAFHLEGVFYFDDRNNLSTVPDLIVFTVAHDTTYNHDGTWQPIEGNMLEISLHRGLSDFGTGIMPKLDSQVFVDRPSFKPFKSRWTIRKLTRKDMQLELTLDNRKYYLRFKPYKS